MATSKKSTKKSTKRASTKRIKKAVQKTAAGDQRVVSAGEVVTRSILRHQVHRPHGTGLADLSLWHEILEHPPRPEADVEPTGRILS